ncbi:MULTISPECIES: hypothetical protein [unclassified Streptomyces]|uniref:hypothetical protein n=1 Tax=unclassified Streptomyces TaxID=2593676 RepID=UPI0008DC9AA6|nr:MULTISPECIES: hypothetical protein [unclassified Streptomyces]OII66478.1 hypothetical protein BJP39_08550 [Streptomyces sp. CC77]
MRRTVGVFLSVLLLGGTACSVPAADGPQRREAAAASDEARKVREAVATCERLLGTAAVGWLKQTARPADLRMESEIDVPGRVSRLRQQVREWDPQSSGRLDPFPFLDMCKIDVEAASGAYTLQYARSVLRSDEVRGAGGTYIEVHRDLALVYESTEQRSGRTYMVYIKCGIPGAAPEQREELPIQGILHDGLTGDRDPRVHFAHLLHSAQVMVKALGCTNAPVVPDHPPASVA